MTLNITIVHPHFIVQASDRRFTNAVTHEVLGDSANKAIVMRCADALLSITFTGIGTFPAGSSAQRMDWWLAESLLEACMPELTADEVLRHISERSTSLFEELRHTLRPEINLRHAFVVAGWDVANPARPTARAWVITNAKKSAAGSGVEISNTFETTDEFVGLGNRSPVF
ncbi:MAG: hypothetical protein WBD55_09100, partial [Dehalococcoidia bacterium]